MSLVAVPIKQKAAFRYVAERHRHHEAPVGWLFGFAAKSAGELVGVVIVGRPTARLIQEAEPLTCEVTRCCTDGTDNACSFLYARATKVAGLIGYTRIISYTLPEEGGASLKALRQLGWRQVKTTGGGSWDRPNRSRTDKAPTGAKWLWECVIARH